MPMCRMCPFRAFLWHIQPSGTTALCGLPSASWPLRLEYVVYAAYIHAVSRGGWPGSPVAGGSFPSVVLTFKYPV